MFYKEDVKIQLKDFGKNGFIKNRAILEMFENVATYHSDSLGHGPNNIEKTGSSWVLFDWKIKVIKRQIWSKFKCMYMGKMHEKSIYIQRF